MKCEAYIKSGNSGKDFYYVFSLLDLDDLPIVFIARDVEWQMYLCDCTEFRFGKQNWTIARTNPAIIKDVINHRMSVYSALKALSNNIVLAECDLETDLFIQTITSIEKIPYNRLPERDAFILYGCEDVLNNLSQFEIEYYARSNKPTTILSDSFINTLWFSDESVAYQGQIQGQWERGSNSSLTIKNTTDSGIFESSFERVEAA